MFFLYTVQPNTRLKEHLKNKREREFMSLVKDINEKVLVLEFYQHIHIKLCGLIRIGVL